MKELVQRPRVWKDSELGRLGRQGGGCLELTTAGGLGPHLVFVQTGTLWWETSQRHVLKGERNAQKVGRLSIQRGREKGLRGQSIKCKEMSLMHQEMIL